MHPSSFQEIGTQWAHFWAPMPNHGPIYFLKLLLGLFIGFVFIAVLQTLPTNARKPTIVFFTFLGGLYYSLEFFLPLTMAHHKENFLTGSLPLVGNASNALITMSYGLGVISLLGMHFRMISRRRDSWGNSIVVIVSFFAMMIFGLLNAYDPDFAITKSIHASDVYSFLFNGIYTPLDSAMFALIAFFIVSASYRAFRIRNVEASMLMFSAMIVMLGQVTLGTALTQGLPTKGWLSYFRMENMSEYILVHINSPALRAVLFGIALGLLATSLRLWLSLERGAYFDSEA